MISLPSPVFVLSVKIYRVVALSVPFNINLGDSTLPLKVVAFVSWSNKAISVAPSFCVIVSFSPETVKTKSLSVSPSILNEGSVVVLVNVSESPLL